MIQKIKNSIILQLICIVFVILIVLTGTLYASYLYVKQTTTSYAATLSDSLLRQADNALSLYKENLRYSAELMCHYVVVETEAASVSDAKPSEEPKASIDTDDVSVAMVSSYFTQISMKNREIVSAVIFDRDMNEVMSLGKQVTLPEKQMYLRHEEDLNADWYFPDKDDFYYAFYYPIYDENNASQQIGMCVFVLEHWRIDGTLHNILNDSMSAMLLSDSNNLDLSFHSFGNVPPDVTMSDLKENPDYVYREGNWQNGIRIAVAVSISGNTSGSSGIRKLILMASILTLVLLAIIIFYSYLQLARPIHELDRFIDDSIEHPDRRLEMSRTDEIGKVASSLDHMLDENQRMIEEIKDSKIRLYETELSQQKMEIRAYRNQINPHFLFNALESIRMHSLLKSEKETAEMVEHLAIMQRVNVDWHSDMVSLEGEMKFIESYLKLQKYRFGERLSYSFDVSPECYGTMIPKLSLVTFVENACVHGIESKTEPGWIFVRIYMTEKDIVFEVEDTGIGMNEEMRNNLLFKMNNASLELIKSGTGVGMTNACLRLKMMTDDKARFDLESEPGVGTTVFIAIPR